NPLLHYVEFGKHENRQIFPSELTGGVSESASPALLEKMRQQELPSELTGGVSESASPALLEKMRQQELPSELTGGVSESASPVTGSPRKILVADYRIPMPDVSAGERTTVGILTDLRELGYEVVFLPHNLEPSPKYEAELVGLGVQVITRAQGYSSSSEFLSLRGHEFGTFYLFRVDVAEGMLGLIREVTPPARVIFHAPDLQFLREARRSK